MSSTRSDDTAASTPSEQPIGAPRELFALIDCDNFFVSCERVFDPSLAGRPVIVLSNNDACVISRSNEAKQMGITMAVPLYQVWEMVVAGRMCVRSANFTLYRDISRRLVHCLGQFCADIEVYSVDEVFMAFRETRPGTLGELIHRIRQTVLQWVGVPVSIGVAETKTLAKVAAGYAKKHRETGGCFDLSSCTSAERDRVLAWTSVDKVWGIGRQYEKWLVARGIKTALALRDIDQHWFGRKAGVVGVRTVKELQGISCIVLSTDTEPRKMITCSRSFGKPVTDPGELREAIATFASQGGRELRHDRSLAQFITVLCIQRRSAASATGSVSTTVRLRYPTDRDCDLIEAALTGLERLYRPGVAYVKGGITLGELSPAGERQADLFIDRAPGRPEKLSGVVDYLNSHWGHGTVRPAATGTNKSWHAKAALRSPDYTTCWQELPVVRTTSPVTLGL